jgi:hypothetical protein
MTAVVLPATHAAVSKIEPETVGSERLSAVDVVVPGGQAPRGDPGADVPPRGPTRWAYCLRNPGVEPGDDRGQRRDPIGTVVAFIEHEHDGAWMFALVSNPKKSVVRMPVLAAWARSTDGGRVLSWGMN